MNWAAVAAALLALLLPSAGSAREVVLPLHVDNAFLLQLLEQQVYTAPDGRADVWRDAGDCSEIILSQPEVGSAAALVRVSSQFAAKLGAGVGRWCLGVTNWHGRVDVLMQPNIHPTLPVVEFRVIDSHLFNEKGERTLTGTIWDWFKARVHPRLESVRVDLYGPLTELKLFLPLVLASSDVARSQQLIESLRIRTVIPTPGGLRVEVALDVPELPSDPIGPPAPVPTLTAEEVERWQETLESWDGFITFLVKRAGKDVQTLELQRALGEILLEARYDLVEALRPSQPEGDDPVRPLFLKTWKRLAPLLRETSIGLPGEDAVRYVSLVTAGDALAALDELGPGFGLHISNDGLRRLARMVEPFAPDPTAHGSEVDPELRRLMGFGDPLPVPTHRPTPVAEPDLEAEEVIDEEILEDEPTPGVLEPLSRFLWPAAYAAEPFANDVARLDRWVPKRDELDDYLPLVRTVLRGAAQQTKAEKKLPQQWHGLFSNMVLSTAWKESCWRQFIRKGKGIETIRSSAGALGIMQINARVWRGLYDVEALRDDISYNARAGTEILYHYMIDYAVRKKEHEQPGGIDNLARATYSAYNAGPGRLSRYRQGKGHAIDRAYWDMYAQVKAGNELAVASCFGV